MLCVCVVCACVYVHAPVVVNNFTRSDSDAWQYLKWMFVGNYNSAELLLMPNIAVVIFF